LVWTAALAEWGQLNATDPACKSVLKENVLGLKLQTQGGICVAHGNTSRCPVFEGLSEKQLAQCIVKWQASSKKYAAISPMIPMNSSDGKTPLLPIRFSSASGSSLFASNLVATVDYTNMIKETRKYVDDDASLRSWMSGIPFDYWEQYLSIVDVMLLIGGLSILAGFVISFAFIFMELSFSHRGTCLKRLFASCPHCHCLGRIFDECGRILWPRGHPAQWLHSHILRDEHSSCCRVLCACNSPFS
jgi:hypothetical protein